MRVIACAGGRGPFPSAHALSQPSRLAEWRLVRAYGWVARCGKVACWDLISEVTMAPSCCQKGLRIFPEPRPASVYGCHLYLRLSLPRHGSSPRCLCSSLKPWIGSNISLEGDISGVWASGGLAGGALAWEGALGNQPQVWTERWPERLGYRECLGLALESCGEPGHALTGTSRDPRLFWGTVSRQEAGTCEKGICQSEAEQSV